MEILPLGAGQDVGKSCVLVSIDDKMIMFDCGMHMGYSDKRRFPDFSFLKKLGDLTAVLDGIVISHFHIDHCGALPYFTEVLGYKGPIYMTPPTKAALPIILEDSRKILDLKSNQEYSYTPEHIKNCMKKITVINMNETFYVSKKFFIKPFYAGHVIGAAMFYVVYNGQSVVYTGDFSTLADRHLKSAHIDAIKPNLLIIESTYGGVLKECKKSKEREMLQIIQNVIDRKGKVLIPIFALGRAQEICLLIESYWERLGLKTPIYFSMGLTDRVNDVYSRFSSFTNQTTQEKMETQNVFEFKFIQPFYKSCLESENPCVIFATPAMLHSGSSLMIFKALCRDAKNAVILPGYCSRGTIGELLINGVRKIALGRETFDVRMDVHNIAFSAHADMAGIFKIIRQSQPKNIMLVHGEKTRMIKLKKAILEEVDVPIFMPMNGTQVSIPIHREVEIKIEKQELMKHVDLSKNKQKIEMCLELDFSEDEVYATNIQNISEK
ncbi:CPSF3L [Ecytonucleospora hepatopenaei]|uniref:CPSF3L n=1 Tax=Ecytonucleospora hepatopenaei TaxID=646526 RepID=A0A1W0E5W7_9MICR|nr:CPSF3L [Ecytonucleospora hepatopenaei]